MKQEIERLKERLMQVEVQMASYKEILRGLDSSCQENTRMQEALQAKCDGLGEAALTMTSMMEKMVKKLSEMTGAKGEVGKELAEAMRKEMEDIYEEKVKSIVSGLLGSEGPLGEQPLERVLCDLCGQDYSLSPDKGGLLLGSQVICPRCSPGIEEKCLIENAEKEILDRCPGDISFSDWVRLVVRRQDGKTVGDWRDEGDTNNG